MIDSININPPNNASSALWVLSAAFRALFMGNQVSKYKLVTPRSEWAATPLAEKSPPTASGAYDATPNPPPNASETIQSTGPTKDAHVSRPSNGGNQS